MAADSFIKMTDIEGESSDDKHKKEIDVLSWSWGGTQSATTHHGTGGGQGKVNVQDFSFTKRVDSASPATFLACALGTHIKECVFVQRKAGKEPLEFYKLTMSDVLISSIQVASGSGGNAVDEVVSLNFAKFKIEYTPQKEDGTGAAPKIVEYNIATNKKV